jgi:hypothetical protein
MREFLVNELKKSSSKEIIITATLCLYALLKCLPKEKAAISSSGVLDALFTKTLALCNTKVTVHTLRIAAILLEGGNDENAKLIVSFVEELVHQPNC